MHKIREAAVAGVYQTKQGDLSDRPQLDVWWECAEGACHDAGLTLGDVDGLIGAGPPGVGLRATGSPAGLADVLGRPMRFHASSSVGAASLAAGVNLAVYAVSHGLADAVLIVNAVAGGGGADAGAERDRAVAEMAKFSGPYEYPFGTTRVSDYAIVATRHMYEFGTTPEQLAEVAVAERRSATLHPLSVYGERGEITVADVLSSRLIAEPLRLLDCCGSPQASWEAISGRGEVYTYSVVHRGPTPAYQADAPYVVAHVTMEEGFRMAGGLRGTAPGAVHVGMEVCLRYEDATPRWTLFYFERLP